MSDSPTQAAVGVPDAPSPGQGELFGHPKGLYILSSTEMWERFSFYAMRGVLTLYVVSVVLAKMTAEKGAEFTGGIADQVYGAYMGFVYSAPFIGGMLADRLLGQRRAIYIGGVLMALAHFTLTTHSILVAGLQATPAPGAQPAADVALQLAQSLRGIFRPEQLDWLFWTGLGVLCCGNGFFKPNISTIVGTLYKPEDGRRDAAFTIFYMGINVGAFASALASGAGQRWGWYLAYLLAGLGMVVSLINILAFRKLIAGRGLPPEGATLLKPGRLGVPNAVLLVVGMVAFVAVAAYMISRPKWVQNLANWIAVIVLFYLMWEAARTLLSSASRKLIHLAAALGGICGLVALLCRTLAQLGVDDPPVAVLVPFVSALQWTAIAFLVVAAVGLVFLIIQATRSAEGGRMFVAILLCAFSMVFWGFYELQGSTIIRFADLHLDTHFLGWNMPTAFVVNIINPLLVIVLCIPFTWLWVWLDRKHLDPSTPMKFALGLFQLGLGFLVFWFAAKEAQAGGKASMLYLLLSIFVFTTGELCLSPVGLSMITRLAPARLVGVFMGVWFLSSAVANVITGGLVGSRIQEWGFADIFKNIGGLIIASSVLLFGLSFLLKRLMSSGPRPEAADSGQASA